MDWKDNRLTTLDSATQTSPIMLRHKVTEYNDWKVEGSANSICTVMDMLTGGGNPFGF